MSNVNYVSHENLEYFKGKIEALIPTETTVSGWGFTKNEGTITGIQMNGASKGSSGVVDLGTVITSLNGYATQEWVGEQGYITGIDSSDVTTALGYTPYNSTNPDGYITGIDSTMVTNALGYTPPTADTWRGIKTKSAVDYIHSSDYSDTDSISSNFLRYWNGRISGSTSNLAYCNRGAFGTIVTASSSDYLSTSDGGTLSGKLDITATLTSPGTYPSLSVNYDNNNGEGDLGDKGLNIIKFGTVDNYIGQLTPSRSDLNKSTFVVHSKYGFEWLTTSFTKVASLSSSGVYKLRTPNLWLTPSILILGRTDADVHTEATIGVTDGNLHLDAYDGKYIYLNHYQTTQANSRVYFNGPTYYIQGDTFNGYAKASDVYAWAKASTKPSYTYDEIGAGNISEMLVSTRYSTKMNTQAKVQAGTTVLLGADNSSRWNINNAVTSDYNTIAQIIAGSGGATNGGALGFHNPSISSATIGYYNTDSKRGVFKFTSDNDYYKVLLNGGCLQLVPKSFDSTSMNGIDGIFRDGSALWLASSDRKFGLTYAGIDGYIFKYSQTDNTYNVTLPACGGTLGIITNWNGTTLSIN